MMTVRLFFLGGVLVLGLVTGADAVRAQMADAAVASSSQDGAQEIAVRNTPAKGAQGFIESVARRGIGFLSDASMTPAQQKQSFRNLLRDSFDMATIGRFALGQYWRVATPAQRTEYLRLFEKMIVDVYSERFVTYNGQTLKMDGTKQVNDTDSMVTTFVVPKNGGSSVRVDWRVRQSGGAYRIVDIVVEGVSMSVTQRSDFSAVLNRGGGDIAALIEYLKNPKKG